MQKFQTYLSTHSLYFYHCLENIADGVLPNEIYTFGENGIFILKEITLNTRLRYNFPEDIFFLNFEKIGRCETFSIEINEIQKSILKKIIEAEKRYLCYELFNRSDLKFYSSPFCETKEYLKYAKPLRARKRYRNHLINIFNNLNVKINKPELLEKRIEKLKKEIEEEIKSNDEFWKEFYSD